MIGEVELAHQSDGFKPVLISVELLSDTTLGRGEGMAGLVDADVEHDELGLPFLGGKTLKGLLRDSWLSMSGCFPVINILTIYIKNQN